MCVALQDEAHHGQRHRGLRRVASGLHQDTLHLGTGEIRCHVRLPEGIHVFRLLTSSPTGFGAVLFIVEFKFSDFAYVADCQCVFMLITNSTNHLEHIIGFVCFHVLS